MSSSLKGIKVVDLTQSIAGPFATQILGDLGADVIKIERVDIGDDTRQWGPPFWGQESATFLAYNRNKRSLSINLKEEEGREILESLIKEADILVQNLRPGALDKLGFSYEQVAKNNSNIIYCSINAFGHNGDMKEDPGYDPLIQAFGGLMSITGEEGRPPVRIPTSILDQGTGLWAVIAIMDALKQREQTGKGSFIQTSLLNTALMWLPSQIVGYFADKTIPKRLGSGTVGISPYQAFPTKDGYIIIAAGNDNLWKQLCLTLKREDLISDPKFIHNPERVKNRDLLFEELSMVLQSEESEVWLEKLKKVGVPVTPVQTIDQVVQHDQILSIEAFKETNHPEIDNLKLINTPFLNNGKYPVIDKAPPLLGQHNIEILEELGFTENQIENFIKNSVINSSKVSSKK
ncbi:CaiB/BaiF CoA transferase family protein [Planococcus sp. X10-3]|uniref:CaiB/BaiF CoA transferase family protein n=1 Tax=Planococcus sp. X10-3 TaxID=3061240 RepID=UPI003BB03538